MKTKRLTSLFLSAVLLLSLLSPGMTARAATITDEGWGSGTTVTLETGNTYTLTQNRTVNLDVPAGATVGIDGGGLTLTGTLTLNSGSTVNMTDLNITAPGSKSCINVYGTGVTLKVYGNNTAVGSLSNDSATVQVLQGNALTIDGDGVLTASARLNSAAIGGTYISDYGTIEIIGGTVNATSNGNAAAIGGGGNITGAVINTAGTIEISGGTVNATGNGDGAAIGGGGSTGYDGRAGGTIEISGGIVNATAKGRGAAIGGGGSTNGAGGSGAALTIRGGTVAAVNSSSDTNAVAIGSGVGQTAAATDGSVTITGGSVNGHSQGKTTPFRTAGFATNGTAPVYRVTVQAKTELGILVGAAITTNGFSVVTNEQGEAYLWLPVGNHEFSMSKMPNFVIGTKFSVEANDSNVLVILDSVNLPPPTLTAGAAWRTSVSTAHVTFTSDIGVAYWYKVVEAGAPQPNIETPSDGTPCVAGENTLALTGLTTGEKDIYIIAKNEQNYLSDRAFHIRIPAFVAEPDWPDDGTEIKFFDGESITLTEPHTHKLMVDAGATVAIDGGGFTLTGTLVLGAGSTVTITNLNIKMANRTTSAIQVTGMGASLKFVGSNTMTPYNSTSFGAATVSVSEGTELTLFGGSDSDTFTVTAAGGAAGIGSDYEGSPAGTIRITSGTVNATTTGDGAAIGGGSYCAGGNIEISGGTVVASTSGFAAAIGGGRNGASGNIEMSGGTITASASSGGAAIGSGNDCAGNNSITIRGGTVSASATGYGAAIGGGGLLKGASTITISGGTVTATATGGSAAIGAGAAQGKDSTSTISISGGTVSATANGAGAGIGGGGVANNIGGAAVTISGGTVTAISKNAAGIGGGDMTPPNTAGQGSATITGGNVSGASVTGKSPFLTAGFAKNGAGASVYQTAVLVLDDGGTPVEGAFISADSTYTATTNASGVAHVWLTARAHDLEATKDTTTIPQKDAPISANDQNVLLLTSAIKPVILLERVLRVGATAEVTFVSSAAGVYYEELVSNDAAAPSVDTSGAGTPCTLGRNTITLSQLPSEERDLYIVVKSADGRLSEPLKADLPAGSDDSQWPDDGSALTLPNGADITLTRNHVQTLIVPAGAEVWINGADKYLFGQLQLGSGSTVHLIDLNITMTQPDASAIKVLGTGNKLYLSGTSNINGYYNSTAATIAVPVGTELTIDDDPDVEGVGKLFADSQGRNLGATIGGDAFRAGGTINILGGTIEAYSAYYGAVIGGGQGASGGTLNISGGTVNAEIDRKNDAYTSLGGAVFGGGYNNNGSGGDGGVVNISGGKVTANANTWGTGIGGGNNFSGTGAGGAGAALTITGGWVHVSGGEWGDSSHYDIGQSRSSLEGAPGTTVITGGSLTTRLMDVTRITGWPDNILRYPVTVTVKKASDSSVVPDATITAAGSDYQYPAITDENGKATFWLPNGSYTFSAVQGEFTGSTNGVTVDTNKVSADLSISNKVTFTAEQVGGTLHDVDSTGIKLTFDKAVTGLTADKVTIADGTGAAVKDTLSGSGTEWTIALSSVTTEGDVTVDVADFGDYVFTSDPRTVAVYKQTTRVATTVKIFTDAACTNAVTADTLTIPSDKQYYAATFDQFGDQMSDTHTWELVTADSYVTQLDGKVTVVAGATSGTQYALTATGVDLTVTSVTITVRDITVPWNTIEQDSAITYGDSKAAAFTTTLPAEGTATAPGDASLSGIFAITNPDAILTAGEHTVTVVFTVTDEGDYNGVQLTKDFTVTVNPKPITVTVTPVSRPYGAANPTFTATAAAGALVGEDTITSLNLNLTTAATPSSNAGTYAVTGTASNANYTVTIEENTALTVTPAAITEITGTPSFGAILANDAANTSQAALLAAAQSANETLAASYKDGTTTVNATWAWQTGTWDAKGGSYTLRATLTPADATNFTYTGTKDLTVTVTPVTGTYTYSPKTLVLAKTQVTNAAAMADLGLPTAVAIDYDGGVSDATYDITGWTPDLDTLKAIDVSGGDQTRTLTPTVLFPAWATIANLAALKTELTVTAKFPVTVTVTPPEGVTYGTALGDPSAVQEDSGNGVDANPTWSYHYQGTTRSGDAYSAETAPTAAGTYTVTATLQSDTHSGSGTSTPFTIEPKTLTNGMIEVTGSYTYTGSPITPEYTVEDGALLTPADYTTEVTNNTNAGTASVIATATNTGNYTGTATANFTIAKAAAPAVNPIARNHPTGEVASHTIDLTALLPSDRGTTSYAIVGDSTGDAVAVSAVGASDGQLTYTTTDASTAISTSITVTAAMQNYADATITITIALVDKIFPTGTPQVTGTITYGQPLSELGISVSMMDGETPVPGNIVWETSSVKPAAGDSEQPWVFTPTDTATYAIVTGTLTITVGRATPAGTPTVTAITESGKTLADAALTGSFTNPHDGTAVAGNLTWDDGDSAAVQANTDYGWTFTPTDTGNYEGRTGTLRPYVTGGGGGGDGITAPPAATVDITINGVDVKATLAADGTLTLTYTAADLAKYENESGVYSFDLGGIESVGLTLPIGALEGSDLSIETDYGTVTIPEATLSAIRALCGDTLRLVITKGSFRIALLNAAGEETAYSDPENPLALTLPYTPQAGERGEAIVAINTDTGDILPYAVYADGAVAFAIPATGTYDIRYNGKVFADANGHWAASDIDFVAAREIFNGVGGDRFAPDTDMTRAMFAQVIANLVGADLSAYTESQFTDVAAGAWYAPAVAWAAESGIVNGVGDGAFAPERKVTRGELAVMLYRYIRSIGGGFAEDWAYALTFADGDLIPDWAYEAVSWCAMQGIVTGRPGNVIDPIGTATRAEAAAMLRRTINP